MASSSQKSDIALLKCGVRFQPPAIIVTYIMTGKTRRRTMPLRNFNKHSGVQRVANELRQSSRHARFLESVPAAQLEKLIAMIHDHLNGKTKQAIIEKARTLDRIDPEEDLNKVDETTLNFKKAVMDQTFEKNRKRPDDPDFKYDVEIDFAGAIETCEWDSDDKDSDNGF